MPIMRAPLGPFPEPKNYSFVLPFVPPPNDLYFYRGQFCGLRVVGAPWVPGCEAGNTDLMMTCLLDRYPREWQDRFLKLYASYGYTHIQRSYGHAMASPSEGWAGVSLPQFNELSRRAQKAGLWCDQWIIGGGALYNCNQTLSYWKPIIDELCDSFLSSGTLDHACVGWQLDQIFGAIPGNATIEVIVYISKKIPRRVPLYTHWMNEAMAWWADKGEVWTDEFTGSTFINSRFDWHRVMGHYLTGAHHQGDTWAARTKKKEVQSSLCDTLDYFAGRTDKGNMGLSFRRTDAGEPSRLIAFEETAQEQFNVFNPEAPDHKGGCTEDEGDLIGFVLTCTQGFNNSHLSGYGNGARRQDGSRL